MPPVRIRIVTSVPARNRARISTRVALLVTALVAIVSLVAAPSGHAAVSEWTRVNSPAANSLSGAAAAATNDVWVVGQSIAQQPFAAHWAGLKWKAVATPSLSSGGLFNAVAMTPSGNAWAVGSQFNGSGGSTTLAERWNGSAWQVFSTPNVYGLSTDYNELIDVSVVADDDVWAVGVADRTGAREKSIVAHWDGASWTLSPTQGKVTSLSAVSMVSSTYGLAVGQVSPPGLAVTASLANGTWSAQRLSGSDGQLLHDVRASSRKRAWAVGSQLVDGSSVPFVDHFVKGTGWTGVPPGTADGGVFWALAASATGDMWAVGTDYSNPDLPLTSHWDGAAWTQVAAPMGTDAALLDVTFVPGSEEAWAVGGDADGSMILHQP
jgi:hypothetical protein